MMKSKTVLYRQEAYQNTLFSKVPALYILRNITEANLSLLIKSCGLYANSRF